MLFLLHANFLGGAPTGVIQVKLVYVLSMFEMLIKVSVYIAINLNLSFKATATR